MKNDHYEVELYEDFVDSLLPCLSPYQAMTYLYLFRNSSPQEGKLECRIGKRSMASQCCRSVRGTEISFAQMTSVLNGLEDMNCIRIKDSNREGTLYEVVPPLNVPIVAERLASTQIEDVDADYFNDPEKRIEVFERDQWTCQYCGEKVDEKNSTLDHFIPKSKGGGNNKENLRTACLACNSVKSGKSFEEAAPLILTSISKRRQRSG